MKMINENKKLIIGTHISANKSQPIIIRNKNNHLYFYLWTKRRARRHRQQAARLSRPLPSSTLDQIYTNDLSQKKKTPRFR